MTTVKLAAKLSVVKTQAKGVRHNPVPCLELQVALPGQLVHQLRGLLDGERGPHSGRGGGQLAPLGQCPEKLSLFVLLVQAFGLAVGPVEQGGYDREYYRHDRGAEQDEPP